MQTFRSLAVLSDDPSLRATGAATCRFPWAPGDPVSPIGGAGSVAYGRLPGTGALV